MCRGSNYDYIVIRATYQFREEIHDPFTADASYLCSVQYGDDRKMMSLDVEVVPTCRDEVFLISSAD